MKNKREFVILGFLVLILVAGFLVAPVGTKAQTSTSSADNQAKITELTNQLNSLLKQLIALLTTQLQQLQTQLAAKQGQPVPPPSTAASPTAPTVANKPPRVNIWHPVTGAELSTGESTGIIASAADDDGTISKVEFFQGGSLLGTATGSPYQAFWSNIPAGTYSLTARATDNGGAQTTSQPVTLKVQVPGRTGVGPPSVSLTTNTSTAGTASTTVITITATDNSVGGAFVTEVVFSAAASTSASTSFATDTTAPFSADTTFPKIGQWTVSGLSKNQVGETTRSASTTITITN